MKLPAVTSVLCVCASNPSSDSWIRNFTTQGFGGMGYVASDSSGFLNITNTEATTCVANRGGVAYVDSCANIDLSGSQFDKNLATEAGGVV